MEPRASEREAFISEAEDFELTLHRQHNVLVIVDQNRFFSGLAFKKFRWNGFLIGFDSLKEGESVVRLRGFREHTVSELLHLTALLGVFQVFRH